MLKIEVNESNFMTFHAEGTTITLMAEMTLCVDKLIREIGKGAAEAVIRVTRGRSIIYEGG